MNSLTKLVAISMTSLALVSLGACTTMSKRDTNTAIGAGVGAVAGSILSNGSGVGTVGGAAIGGYIGNQMRR